VTDEDLRELVEALALRVLATLEDAPADVRHDFAAGLRMGLAAGAFGQVPLEPTVRGLLEDPHGRRAVVRHRGLH
jgi:hypothetical protein